ncbi:MAG: serine O-acetyltransferase [Actinobacteria bacterium]|nr:serine O-acetyltransferase [Actinomycetota bacterium]
MLETYRQDIEAVRDRDPAARNMLEIILAYPGLHALWMHRLAHFLWNMDVPVLPRLISHVNRLLTGIEIHPGARFGKGVFIDHGMGVVIGETSEIGDYVTLYQGVTLGGTGKEKGKRHPTVGRNVVIAAGAKVLGPITVGDDSKVGAGAVVIRDVPPRCTVVGIPGRVVMQEGEPVVDLHHEAIPDPVMDQIEAIDNLVKRLEDRLVKTQLELEITEDKLRHAEEELHEVEDSIADSMRPTQVKPDQSEGRGTA